MGNITLFPLLFCHSLTHVFCQNTFDFCLQMQTCQRMNWTSTKCTNCRREVYGKQAQTYAHLQCLSMCEIQLLRLCMVQSKQRERFEEQDQPDKYVEQSTCNNKWQLMTPSNHIELWSSSFSLEITFDSIWYMDHDFLDGKLETLLKYHIKMGTRAKISLDWTNSDAVPSAQLFSFSSHNKSCRLPLAFAVRLSFKCAPLSNFRRQLTDFFFPAKRTCFIIQVNWKKILNCCSCCG